MECSSTDLEDTLPLGYKLIGSSNTTSTMLEGDVILVGCDQEHKDSLPENINRLVCKGKNWQPSLDSLDPDGCSDEVSRK